MPLPIEGYFFTKRDKPELAFIHVFEGDTKDSLNGITHEIIYNPSRAEIIQMCMKHNFHVEHTLNLIDSLSMNGDSMVIHGDVFRQHLMDEGLVTLDDPNSH